jgi:hypothetical protein
MPHASPLPPSIVLDEGEKIRLRTIQQTQGRDKFFPVHDLQDWTRQGRYTHAVNSVAKGKKSSEPLHNNGPTEWTEVDDMQWCFHGYKGEKRYRCPLNVHGPRRMGLQLLRYIRRFKVRRT